MKTPALDKIMQHTLLVALEAIRLQDTDPYYANNPCESSLIIEALDNVERLMKPQDDWNGF